MSEKRGDIFDRMMSLKVLRPLQPFYQRYKEQLLYLFFGGLTTLLSIGLFWLMTVPLGMAPLASNVAGWFICVAFAYVTNRRWVFSDKARGAAMIARECLSFFVGRLGTLALEELVLWVGIDLMSIDGMAVKVAAQVLVIVGNYVISKWFVFKSRA